MDGVGKEVVALGVAEGEFCLWTADAADLSLEDRGRAALAGVEEGELKGR